MANTTLLATDPALRAEHAHFAAIPWCAAHLQSPGWTAVPTRCRTRKSDGEDSLFAETLGTPATIPRCLTLARCEGVPLVVVAASYSSSSEELVAPALAIPAIKTFWALGPALNGFPRVLHGGLVAALLDETIGILLTTNEQHVLTTSPSSSSSSSSTTVAATAELEAAGAEGADARRAEVRRAPSGGGTIDCVTASLQIRFRAPVRTPAEAVLVEAKVVRAVGRRLYLSAELSADGKVCAVGEAVFVRVPSERL
jgi:acyl-coenzyme A thioesterase PaaI-like protein